MHKLSQRKLSKLLTGLLIIGLSFSTVAAAPHNPGLDAPDSDSGINADVSVVLTPLPGSVSNCGVMDLYIDVNNVSNLYGADVRLSFDPAVIEILDFAPATTDVNIEPLVDSANFTQPFSANFTIRNIVDNFRGTLWYAASSFLPTLPAEGSGHIARLRVRAKSSGNANFQWTYIQLADPHGTEIDATGSIGGGLTASSSIVPDINIIRLDKDNVQLQWLAGNSSIISGYRVYRSTTPYFYAQETLAPYAIVANSGTGTPVTFNDASLGSAVNNYFYAVRAVCADSSGYSAASNQVGKFEYQLYETASTDFNMIGLVLDIDPDWTNTSALAAHIANNSSGSVDVKTISKFAPGGQNWTTYTHPLAPTRFNVALKMPYRVEVSVPGNDISVLWAQVGRLPAISTGTYTLYETNGTDFNWILQPLDMTSITRAKTLSEDIIYNASAAVGVITLSTWSAVGQNYTNYIRAQGFTNFTTRFGYPYRVEVNVNTGNTVTWP